MSSSLVALTGFVAWTILLLLIMAGLRVSMVLAGKKQAHEFAPDGADVSPFSNRLCRAHANCLETLPLFAALVLVAHVSGQAGITDPLAFWFLAARVGQTVSHLIAASHLWAQVRFTFFLVQVVIMLIWLVQLLGGF